MEDKAHELLLYKRTDGGKATTAFLGLELDDGAKLPAPGPPPSQLVLIFMRTIPCFYCLGRLTFL